MEKPFVSVVMIAYNQEEYIEEAIESVLMQKVNFSYEILIGDDASSDKTARILDDYQERYPELIKVFHRKKNLGMCRNSYDLFGKCKGKYVAKLEGDDYWTYELKLQTQVDFLEAHKGTVATAHNVLCVDWEGKPLPENLIDFPMYKRHKYGRENSLNGELFGHMSSIVFRNLRDIMTSKQWKLYIQSTVKNDDLLTGITLGMLGYIYCFEEVWGCRRRIFEGISWTANEHKLNIPKFICSNYFKLQQYLALAFNEKMDISPRIANLLKEYIHMCFKEFKWKNIKSVGLLLISYFWSLERRCVIKLRKSG